MISAIVAIDENWGIGFNGQLLERILEDMKYFKELTEGSKVIMGRKTWDSLPKKPLKNRFNIIITHSEDRVIANQPIMFTNLDRLKKYLVKDWSKRENFFVIGGGTIYKELLPYCDRVYITKIYKTHENVDTYFPKLDDLEWKIVNESEILTYNNLQYQFLTYDRIN